MMQFPRIRLIAAPLSPLAVASLAFGLAGPGATPAFAAQHSLEISITNTGDAPLECGAAIAHWFSEDLGVIAPGADLAVSFGYDLESGTIFRLNERDDEMAVLRAWCGRKGEAWATRAEIEFPREAGVAPAPLILNCAASAAQTTCRPKPAAGE